MIWAKGQNPIRKYQRWVFSVFIGLCIILGPIGQANGSLLGKAATKSEPSHTSSTSVTINFGETVTGAISSPGQTDTYTFSANQGDRILIGITNTSGDLWPEIRLYDPGSNLLDTESSPSHAEMTATLPASGTYTILVSDGFNETQTGVYNLFLQRLNNPVNANSISFGEISSGSISKAAEMDAFTFSASAGDVILIGIINTSGDVWPEIRLYDSKGNLLRTESNPTHAEMTVRLAATKYVFLPIVSKSLTNLNADTDFELGISDCTAITVL
jgi:hypothetical protein